MNKNILIGVIVILLVLLFLSHHNSDKNNLLKTGSKINTIENNSDMFPKGTDEVKKTAINLPKMENELEDYKVEIFVEKMVLADCNTRNLFGKIQEKNLDGWGYTYYEFISSDLGPTTKMGCLKDPEEKLLKSSVKLIRYNSKLPIVVYAAPEYGVKYRIWSASKK